MHAASCTSPKGPVTPEVGIPRPGWLRETVDPGSGRACEFVLNLIVRATGPLQHVKTVIRSLHHMERSGLYELFANGLEKIEWGQLVPVPL